MNKTLFLIYFLIETFLDICFFKIHDCLQKETNMMQKIKIIFFNLLHHFIFTFSMIGWTSSNKKVLILWILFIILLRIHWKTNDDNCVITEIENQLCNLDNDDKMWNFLNLIQPKINFNVYNIFYLLLVIVIIKLPF